MPFLLTRRDVAEVDAEAKVLGSCPYHSKKKLSGWHPELRAEERRLQSLSAGEAALSNGKTLNAKYEIVTIPPLWEGGEKKEEQKLAACYESALELARRRRCRTIAFPLLSGDCHGFPKDLAYDTAIRTIRDFLSKYEMTVYLSVKDIRLFHLPEIHIPGLESIEEVKPPKQWWLEESPESETAEELSCPAFSAPCKSAAQPAAPRQAPFGLHIPGSRKLEDLVDEVGESFSQSLLRLIDQKGMKDPEVYQRANVDRRLFSKIRNNPQYQPSKQTALAFALALRLNLDETKDLLGKAGYALSESSKSDIIVTYFIEQQNYDIYDINQALFAYEQPLIGA